MEDASCIHRVLTERMGADNHVVLLGIGYQLIGTGQSKYTACVCTTLTIRLCCTFDPQLTLSLARTISKGF